MGERPSFNASFTTSRAKNTKRRLSKFERFELAWHTSVTSSALFIARTVRLLDFLHDKLLMASAGSKRGRSDWEDCVDVDELKQHLSKQQDQIEKLRKEKAELTKALRGAEGQPSDDNPEELNAQAARIRKSLSNISAQMVYRSKNAILDCS